MQFCRVIHSFGVTNSKLNVQKLKLFGLFINVEYGGLGGGGGQRDIFRKKY